MNSQQLQARAFEARADLEREFVSCAVAACCSKTASINDIATICPVEMINSNPAHALYRALVEVGRSGLPVTLETVWNHIRTAKQNREKGEHLWAKDVEAGHLASYAASVFGGSYDALEFYAARVRNEGLKRQAESQLMRLVADCQRFGNEIGEIATGAAQVAKNLEGGESACGDLSALMDRLVAQVESGAGTKPMPTPYPALNSVLKGGFAPGELVILAARPGMGKTAFAGCLAVEAARQCRPALFISREVKDTTLAARLVARESRVDLRYFREGMDRAPNVMPDIRHGASRLRNLPLRIVEKSIAPMTPSEVRRLARTTRDVRLIVVDYLQLLNPDTKSLSREREVAEMSRAMKQLALDCDCPVLLLSQLNRQSEETAREPRLSDLRESGAIEQDADIVIFLHARKHEARLARMPVKAIVAKGRSSGTGACHFLFDKVFADFTEDLHAQEWATEHGGERYDDNDL